MGVALGKISSEMPAHEVLRRADGYEVWRYPPSVSAVVRAADLAPANGQAPTERAFQNEAFGLLARYIGVFATPQNRSAATTRPQKVAMTAPVVITPAPEKIAMTAPVVMAAASSDNGETMRFLLPAKFRSIEDAPVPTNPQVKLALEPAGRVEAVLRFSGEFDMDVAAKRAEELRTLLERDGLKPVDDWTLHGYNPPFTLPQFKRNEIHFSLDSAKFSGNGSERSG